MKLTTPRSGLRGREGLLIAGLSSVTLGGSIVLSPSPAEAAQAARGIAGIFFLVAALLLSVDWRVRPARRKAWLAAAVGLLAGELGLYSLGAPLPVAASVLVATVTAYGALTAIVVRSRRLPRWIARRLLLALVLVAAGHGVAAPWFSSGPAETSSSGLLVVAGALWAGTAYRLLHATLDSEHERSARLETSLLEFTAADRGTREALHELKSTVAGLARAAELLTDADVPVETRKRMQRLMVRELARLERRLWLREGSDTASVDLDATLDTVLDLHRARGRSFAWTPSGASVEGRPDAIAEAVNILLDNAATHGDSATGRVDVGPDDTDADMVRIAVSDDGPGVPPELRQRIFEWGESGPGSSGQGIGLNLARRLVNEQGGSLTLSDDGAGSSFVIRLPAARRSKETCGAGTQHAAS